MFWKDPELDPDPYKYCKLRKGPRRPKTTYRYGSYGSGTLPLRIVPETENLTNKHMVTSYGSSVVSTLYSSQKSPDFDPQGLSGEAHTQWVRF